MKATVFLAVISVGIAYAVAVAVFYETCNEERCVYRVSKCQLTGACGCTLENCTCCVNCTLCLAELWDDCCACVSMCKPRNLSANNVASYSTVGVLQTSLDWSSDTLFKAFTSGKPMPDAHWTVDHVTPEDEGVNLEGILGSAASASSSRVTPTTDTSQTSGGFKTSTSSATSTGSLNETLTVTDDMCTVAYLKMCLGLEKCVDACQHMGSTKYRWFHTGCCECIGKSCLSYGRNKAQCADCPND